MTRFYPIPTNVLKKLSDMPPGLPLLKERNHFNILTPSRLSLAEIGRVDCLVRYRFLSLIAIFGRGGTFKHREVPYPLCFGTQKPKADGQQCKENCLVDGIPEILKVSRI